MYKFSKYHFLQHLFFLPRLANRRGLVTVKVLGANLLIYNDIRHDDLTVIDI